MISLHYKILYHPSLFYSILYYNVSSQIMMSNSLKLAYTLLYSYYIPYTQLHTVYCCTLYYTTLYWGILPVLRCYQYKYLQAPTTVCSTITNTITTFYYATPHYILLCYTAHCILILSATPFSICSGIVQQIMVQYSKYGSKDITHIMVCSVLCSPIKIMDQFTASETHRMQGEVFFQAHQLHWQHEHYNNFY